MRVEVIKAPGYEDRWEGTLISYLPHPDSGRVAVVASDDGTWHVFPYSRVREVSPPQHLLDYAPLYARCGCIFPCPDHKTPTQDARADDAYWNSKES